MRKLFALIITILANHIVHGQWTSNGTSLYPTSYSTTNVGLGTAAPTKRLEIAGYGSTAGTPLLIRNDFLNEFAMYSYSDVATHRSQLSLFRSRGTFASPTAISSGDLIGEIAGNPYINGAFRAGATIDFYSGTNPSATSYPVNIQFSTTGNGQTSRIERMRITEDGNVGIGTSTPGSAYKLDVNGYINATGLYVNNTLFTGTSQWTTSGTNLYNANTNMNVGIGTTTPAQKLDVNGIVNASGFYINGVAFAGGGSQWTTQASTANIYYNAGTVGIGTTSTGSFKLAVEGKIGAREVNVTTTNPWPDYVFDTCYNLPSLEELSAYIKLNKHLPEVPSASAVETNGVNLGEMNAILLKKVEELTLYVIELKKENAEIKEKLSTIK